METAEVLTLLQDVSARVIEPRFRHLTEGEVAEKNPGDLVTVADREAEVLLTDALLAAHPDAVVLGEEAYAGEPELLERYTAADHAFTVDPVDGTKNFVNGSPDHAVMVAELRAGEVVRGWVWQPQHRAAFVAERGAGAWRDGQPITRAAPPSDPAALRVVTSRRSWVGRSLPGLAPLELTWACCGVDYPRLLEGAADAVLYSGAKPWDHAPGSLLVSEAGAHLGHADGTPYDATREPRGGLVAAADRATYELVVERLAQAGWR